MPKRVSLTMSDEDYARFLALARHYRRSLSQQILASLDSSYRSAKQQLLKETDYRSALKGDEQERLGTNHLVDAKSLYEVAAGE
jgi:hypothetical protein